MNTEEIERSLRRIEEQLRELASQKRSVDVHMIRVVDAAQALSRSKSTIWAMIRDGELRTKFVRGVRMVPMTEIFRIASIEDRVGPTTTTPVVVRQSAKAEMDVFRATLRKPKKR